VPVPSTTSISLQTDPEIAGSAITRSIVSVRLSRVRTSGPVRTSLLGRGAETALRSPCSLPDPLGMPAIQPEQTEMRTTGRIARFGRPDPALARTGPIVALSPAKALTEREWPAKARPTRQALRARARLTAHLGLSRAPTTDRSVRQSENLAADTTSDRIELMPAARQDTRLHDERMRLRSSQDRMAVQLQHIMRSDRWTILGIVERIIRLRVQGPTGVPIDDKSCSPQPIRAARTSTPRRRGSRRIPTTAD
jgi:hypothetical protein